MATLRNEPKAYDYTLISFYIGGIDPSKAIRVIEGELKQIVKTEGIRDNPAYLIGASYAMIHGERGARQFDLQRASIVVISYSQKLTQSILQQPVEQAASVMDQEIYTAIYGAESHAYGCQSKVDNIYLKIGVIPRIGGQWFTPTRRLDTMMDLFGVKDPKQIKQIFVESESWVEVGMCSCPSATDTMSVLPAPQMKPPLWIWIADLTRAEINSFSEKDSVHTLRPHPENPSVSVHYYEVSAAKKEPRPLPDWSTPGELRVNRLVTLSWDKVSAAYKQYAHGAITISVEQDGPRDKRTEYLRIRYANPLDALIANNAGYPGTVALPIPKSSTFTERRECAPSSSSRGREPSGGAYHPPRSRRS